MTRPTAAILSTALAELDNKERLDKDEMIYILQAAWDLDLITKQEATKAIAAVNRYQLGCRHIYRNWDSRPRATKVGSRFREINASHGTSSWMCLNLSPHCRLDQRAKKATRKLIGTGHLLTSMLRDEYGIRVGRGWQTRHFYNNWELFHKDPSLFRAEVDNQVED